MVIGNKGNPCRKGGESTEVVVPDWGGGHRDRNRGMQRLMGMRHEVRPEIKMEHVRACTKHLCSMVLLDAISDVKKIFGTKKVESDDVWW
jgi:hypothetical protein